MSITIKDVALAAGVSVSTVSKVINNSPSISQKTKDKVHDVIGELDYIPNSRAVSFAKKSTKSVLFLTSLSKDNAYLNPHMFDIMCGAYAELSKRDYTVTLMDTSKEAYPGETVNNIISAGSADGVVIHGSALDEKTSSFILQRNFPHILIGNPGNDSPLCWIDTNHTLAGQFAAEHLLSKGYTSAAFIGGRKADMISAQRLKGVRSTFLKAGHRMSKDHILYTNSSQEAAYQATLELLSLENIPQAIICENNTIALGVSKAIKQQGLSVPADLAFLTFNRYPYASIIEPQPTIIDIDMYDMGCQAGIAMARKLESPALLVQSFTTLPLLLQGQST